MLGAVLLRHGGSSKVGTRWALRSTRPLSAAAALFGTPPSAALASPTPATATGGDVVAALAQENAHMDVVKYTHKNRVWSLQHVNYYAEALAIGLVENGLKSGDRVLSWLPAHFSEQMVLQFACSKSGLILYTLDPATATKDKKQAESDLAAALTLTEANVFISQEAGSDVNYVALAENIIPEISIFDFSWGAPFVTPRFPHLRLPIHTGFDQDEKEGWLLLKHMIVPAGNLDTHIDVNALTADTPLAGELVLEGTKPVKLGKTLSNKEVYEKKTWPTYCNILDKKFHVVEGVGVIF